MGTTNKSLVDSSIIENHIINAIVENQELHGTHIEEFNHDLTPIEFSRFVSKNRPFVIRKYGQRQSIDALTKWNRQYITQKLNDKITIAIDPEGLADSIRDGVFVEPYYMDVHISDFFEKLDNQTENAPVPYLQSQNDNLRTSPLNILFDDLPKDISFATEALGLYPDAVNLWIGDERSKTSLHKDPYENLYLAIEGTKTFLLYPPIEIFCMHEQNVPFATYNHDMTLQKQYEQQGQGQEQAGEKVEIKRPCIPIDPLLPNQHEIYPRFKYAKPIQVTLEKGDLMYLPSFWIHHVRQSKPKEPNSQAISVNWWYDQQFGPNFALMNISSNISRILS